MLEHWKWVVGKYVKKPFLLGLGKVKFIAITVFLKIFMNKKNSRKNYNDSSTTTSLRFCCSNVNGRFYRNKTTIVMT